MTQREPPMTAPSPSDPSGVRAALYVLVKDGVYWRPNAQGYTGILAEAGRYDKATAEAWVHHDRGATRTLLASEATRLAPNCPRDQKVRFLDARLTAAEAENARLRAALNAETQRANEAVIAVLTLAERTALNDPPVSDPATIRSSPGASGHESAGR